MTDIWKNALKLLNSAILQGGQWFLGNFSSADLILFCPVNGPQQTKINALAAPLTGLASSESVSSARVF